MSTFTKAQILAQIAADLPDNTTNQITPDDLRGVLNNLLNMMQGANFISYLNEELTGVTNVQGALDALVTLIEGGTLLTAQQIRDLLQTLTGANRLNKSAIQGADFALNRRGKGDVTDTAGFQMGMSNRLKGDFWIYDDGLGGGGGGGGESETLNNGDWIVALVNNATLHSTDSGYLESAQWWVVKFGGDSGNGSTMSAEEIRDALQTLTGPDMLNGAKVKYSHTLSIIDRLNEMQEIIQRIRLTFDSPIGASSYTITGILMHPIQLCINRVPYQGVQGSTFSGYDFRYVHSSGNTVITINPGLGVSFNTNDIIDILYTT